MTVDERVRAAEVQIGAVVQEEVAATLRRSRSAIIRRWRSSGSGKTKYVSQSGDSRSRSA
jgi:hypothetical protein